MVNRREFIGAVGVLTVGSFAGCLGNENGGDKGDDTGQNTDVDQLEEDATRRDISQQYQLGTTSVEGGKAGIQNGIIDFNIDRYTSAIDSFESAIESFERAEGQFSEGVKLTYNVENSDAREICERGESHAATLRNAAKQYKQAAQAADNDRDPETVNSRISKAESLETEAEQSPLRDQSTLESVLDL